MQRWLQQILQKPRIWKCKIGEIQCHVPVSTLKVRGCQNTSECVSEQSVCGRLLQNGHCTGFHSFSESGFLKASSIAGVCTFVPHKAFSLKLSNYKQQGFYGRKTTIKGALTKHTQLRNYWYALMSGQKLLQRTAVTHNDWDHLWLFFVPSKISSWYSKYWHNNVFSLLKIFSPERIFGKIISKTRPCVAWKLAARYSFFC